MLARKGFDLAKGLSKGHQQNDPDPPRAYSRLSNEASDFVGTEGSADTR